MYKVYYQRFWGLLRPDQTSLEYLPFTHRLLREIDVASLDEVFTTQQGEVWSPKGEARPLIESLHLRHTSMSVGDVVCDNKGTYQVCDFFGWLEVSPSLDQPDDRPSLWISVDADETFMKITDDRDCLPPDAKTVECIAWVSFDNLVTLAGLLKTQRWYDICIEIGDNHYETKE